VELLEAVHLAQPTQVVVVVAHKIRQQQVTVEAGREL
jgi:hypothetical protein